ncbi:DUF6452 family protein [Aquimarina hainanensis]|uniref:DUF6452 family protein n=1 Tax=Aquimarina hainanensis TaxID=1578017 RepID=A0ABW5NFE6_9FLAO
MRNSFKKILTLLILSGYLYSNSGCERDDICSADTPTTPKLVIRFIDNITNTEVKNPVQLEVKAIDSTINEPYDYGEIAEGNIMIPLNTNSTVTKYELTINSQNENPALINRDTISIEYTPVEDYVSSACGFRVTFEGITSEEVIEQPTENNWIKRISVERSNITNEESAHIFIYH